MILIQCTQKLLKEVGQEYKEVVIPTFPLGCWHANLITIDRRKCVLFTNDPTRYSFLVPCLRKPDLQRLDHVFRQNFFRCLVNEGIAQEDFEKALEEIQEIGFTRTSNRSILGTMNEIVKFIEWTVQDECGLLNTDISKLNMDINRIPTKLSGSKYAIEALKEALAES